MGSAGNLERFFDEKIVTVFQEYRRLLGRVVQYWRWRRKPCCRRFPSLRIWVDRRIGINSFVFIMNTCSLNLRKTF